MQRSKLINQGVLVLTVLLLADEFVQSGNIPRFGGVLIDVTGPPPIGMNLYL